MNRVALLLCALTALGLTLGATFADPVTPLVIGANEDHPKFQDDAGAAMYGELSAIGLTQGVVSVRWDPEQPETIPGEERLAAVIAAAKEQGVRVVLAVYPAKARAVADYGPAGFVEFCGRVATSFPDAEAFIVGNEPNQPRFWQPQFDRKGRQVSARAFLTVLAGCYDRIHEAGKLVVGVGLSPRGNDRPLASSNVSTSPVRFLAALGAAYRASGRTEPIMDAFGFHAYPNANTDAPQVGYQWPNAGVPNYARIKQALWDAFNGTPQRHVENGLPLWLDEIGWQVPTDRSDAYTGAENVPTVDERSQAAYHGTVVRLAACDPDVEALHFFHWIDESERTGFQSGAYRADGTRRAAYDAIAQAVADTKGGTFCPGSRVSWRHATSVVKASASFTGVQRTLAATARAEENARIVYGLVRVGLRRTLRASDKKAVAAALTSDKRSGFAVAVKKQSLLRAYRKPPLALSASKVPAGRYVFAIAMAAEANPARTSVFVSPTFVLRGGPLTVQTAAAGRVLLESALLRGRVKAPKSATLEAWFEYGPGTTLGRRTRTALLTGAGGESAAQLANLTPRSQWSYRLVVRERGKPSTLSVGTTRTFTLAKPFVRSRLLLGGVETTPDGVVVTAVVSATADVAVALRLRRTDEAAFRTVQTTEAAIGRAGQDVFVRLGARRLSPGSYLARVVATDGRGEAMQTFSFRVG